MQSGSRLGCLSGRKRALAESSQSVPSPQFHKPYIKVMLHVGLWPGFWISSSSREGSSVAGRSFSGPSPNPDISSTTKPYAL